VLVVRGAGGRAVGLHVAPKLADQRLVELSGEDGDVVLLGGNIRPTRDRGDWLRDSADCPQLRGSGRLPRRICLPRDVAAAARVLQPRGRLAGLADPLLRGVDRRGGLVGHGMVPAQAAQAGVSLMFGLKGRFCQTRPKAWEEWAPVRVSGPERAVHMTNCR